MQRVLVVDDETAILEALEDVLSSEGYDVRTACNGREGLRRMREATPDILLLDLMMPVVDGHQMLEEIESDPRLAGTPVVLMSAGTLSQPRFSRPFLAKPFELATLLSTLRGVLGKAQPRALA